MPPPPTPTLVYLYGPPAVGKLTVATELEALTGMRLFHNHLTLDAVRAVFDFASAPFTDVIRRFRLDVFETAARNHLDLIFTNNSVWGVPNGRAMFAAFAEEAGRRVEGAGGRVVFVQLTAPTEVLEERVTAASRRERGKLVNPARLREVLALLDASPLYADDLLIDTSTRPPAAAASAIAAHLAYDLSSASGAFAAEQPDVASEDHHGRQRA